MRVVDLAAEWITVYFAGLRPVKEAVDLLIELMVVWFAGLGLVEVVGRFAGRQKMMV